MTPGYTVPVFYDSMIAKLVAWGDDRAVGDRADGARAARVPGARHPHDDSVLPVADATPGVSRGRYDTTYLDRLLAERRGRELHRASNEHAGRRTSVIGRSARRRRRRLPPRAAERRAADDQARRGRAAPSARVAAARRGGEAALREMTFEIEIDGRSRSVSIEPAGGDTLPRRRSTGTSTSSMPCASATSALSLLVDGDTGIEP